MNPPKIVDRERWLEARLELLDKEKAFDKERDASTRTRQELPWVPVERAYVFEHLLIVWPGDRHD
jgi:predicted dithiol-disulfide oxidoreductase (DUF899 family)